MHTYLYPQNRPVYLIESTSLSQVVLLLILHLLQNLNFGKRKQQGPSGSKWLTGVCAKIFDLKAILVIGAPDEYVNRRWVQTLKTLRNALSPSSDYIKVLVCIQSEFEDNLGSSPTLLIGDRNGAQIELAVTAQLEVLPGLDASDKDYCMTSHHKQRNGPLSLHSSYHQIFAFWKRPWRRPLERRLDELPDELDDSYQEPFHKSDSEHLDLLQKGLTWSIFCRRDPTVAEDMEDHSVHISMVQKKMASILRLI